MPNCQILGILNLTSDSFSDGGRYLDPKESLAHANFLLESGADILDIGAESSHPDSESISEELEWERIQSLWNALDSSKSSIGKFQLEEDSKTRIILGDQWKISIDSHKPFVLKKALERKVDYWNDITSLREEESIRILEYSNYIPNLILMFSHNQGNRASRESKLSPESILETIFNFFDLKRKSLIKIGIPEEKIIYDPGMGFFLGSNPDLSYNVMKGISLLKQEFNRICISVSRKSFLTSAIGNFPPNQRNFATLAAEIFAYSQSVDFIRTHEPRPILHSIAVWDRLHKT